MALQKEYDVSVLTMNQFYDNRPFAGCGAPHTPIHSLYISNSIWPMSHSALESGVIAAKVAAEDLGVREQSWWVHKGFDSNMRVLERWHTDLKPRG